MKVTKVMTIVVCVILVATCALALTACDSNSVSIGVQAGTTGSFYVGGDEDWGFDGFSNVTLKEYDNAGLAVLDMINGNINYVITDNGPAAELVNTYSTQVKLIDIELTDSEQYAIGVDKAQDDLLASINTVLAEMIADGTMDEINATYADSDGVTSATKDLSNTAGQLVVATNAEFAPFEYMEGNKYYGIDMEIIAYIASELGLELVIENMEFDSVVTSVGSNGVDVAIAALTVSDTRKEAVNFTDSYATAYQTLIVLIDDTSFDNCTTAAEVEAIIASL